MEVDVDQPNAKENNDWFRIWQEHTTWHGMSDLFYIKFRACKALWVIMLIITTIMFTVTVYSHIVDYMHGDTWIRTTQYERHPRGHIPFPSIVICSFNTVSKQKLKELNVSLDVASYIADAVSTWDASYEDMFQGSELLKKVTNEYNKEVEKRGVFSIAEWLHMLSPNCSDMFIICSYGGRTYFDCCDYAQPLYFPGRGLCFTIDITAGAKFMTQSGIRRGVRSGLDIYLNTDPGDYAPVMKFANPNNGFLVFATYSPEYTRFMSPVAVGSGTRTYISMMTENSTMRMPVREVPFLYPMHIPKPDCRQNGELLFLKGQYTVESCMADCEAQQIRRTCGCNFLAPLKSTYNMCDPLTIHHCRHTIADDDEQFDNCISHCQEPCSRLKVIFWSSTTQFPNMNTAPPFIQLLERMDDDEDENFTIGVRRLAAAMRDNRIQVAPVSLFFESTKVRHITKVERYNVETLLSNVGGALGIWAGISLITVFQAVTYAAIAFMESMAQRKLIRNLADRTTRRHCSEQQPNVKSNNEALEPFQEQEQNVKANDALELIQQTSSE